MTQRRSIAGWCLLITLTLLFGSCDGCRRKARSKYYNSLEKIGLEKREVLIRRVDKARDAQENAQEQFEDALEQFQALVGHDGGELEAMYENLKGEYESAESRAEKVRDRIIKVENVAEALFLEWQQEIDLFENAKFQRDSKAKLRETKARYSSLLTVMNRASASMDPVLLKLRDQVLYLKHNLNAQALGSLDRQAQLLQDDVDSLLRDLQASITEADRFIAEISGESPPNPD